MLTLFLLCVLQTDTATISLPEIVLDGESLGLKVTGLARKEKVRLHLVRGSNKWQNEQGNWKQVQVLFDSWAEYCCSPLIEMKCGHRVLSLRSLSR